MKRLIPKESLFELLIAISMVIVCGGLVLLSYCTSQSFKKDLDVVAPLSGKNEIQAKSVTSLSYPNEIQTKSVTSSSQSSSVLTETSQSDLTTFNIVMGHKFGGKISSPNSLDSLARIHFEIRGTLEDGKVINYNLLLDAEGTIQTVTPVSPTVKNDLIPFFPESLFD